VKLSLTTLQRLAEDRSLVQTATRPINIIASAWEKGLMPAIEVSLPAIDRAALDSREGVELLEALELTGPPLAEASSTEDSEKICGLIRSLQRPINAFFESTMVMVDDPVVRSARLSLLAICSHQLEVAGDFSELVLEGV
jgi:glycyl-tRNA synthetase beta chain